MGHYRFEPPKKEKVMPSGWLGIGCIFMIFLPVVAYYGAFLLIRDVDSVREFWLSTAPGLFGRISIHPWLLKVNALDPFWLFLHKQTNLMLYFVFGTLILIVLSGIVGMLYGFMYRIVMPTRYGPTDAPPQKRKTKRYNR